MGIWSISLDSDDEEAFETEVLYRGRGTIKGLIREAIKEEIERLMGSVSRYK